MIMQKDWKLEEIKRLEKERDRNLAIHCNYVAAIRGNTKSKSSVNIK